MSLEQRDLREMLETAIVAARLAGQHAMEQMSYVTTTQKSENELVTQADPQCQRIIIQQIREIYPDQVSFQMVGVPVGGRSIPLTEPTISPTAS